MTIRSFCSLVALLIAICISFTNTTLAQTSDKPAADSETPIEVGDSTVSDREIRERIRGLLEEIKGYEKVWVSVSSGVVTLRGEVLDGAAEEELLRIVGRVKGVVTIENELSISSKLDERLAPALERVLKRLEAVFANAPIFLVALAVFAIIAALGWLLTAYEGLWNRIAPNSFIADIYRAIARIAFLVLGLIVALDILNATALIGAVLGAAGVVGLALGFAVRDTVENFIASILLSLRKPFQPNDFIEIAGDMGNVARLTSRATILISPDGNHVRIPNATVYKGRIINYTRNPNRRFMFELGVDSDADLAAALATSAGALESLDFVLKDPPVAAWIKRVGESNVVLEFAGWIDQRESDYMKARGEAIRRTKGALEAAGFGLPEPTYRLRVEDRSILGDLPSELPESKPEAPIHSDAALPSAAAPEVVEQATEDAVDREREATDASEDLLRETNRAE